MVFVLLPISSPTLPDARQDCYHLNIDARTELIRQNSQDAAAYLHRGHAYLSKGEYGQAHPDYIKAMEYDNTLLFDIDKFSGYDRSTSKTWPTQKGALELNPLHVLHVRMALRDELFHAQLNNWRVPPVVVIAVRA